MMTISSSRMNSMRNERFMCFYIGEFKRLCELLFYGRSGVMMRFYGRAFDRLHDSVELIGGPVLWQSSSPTMHMICREAKFVLDSELLEAETLDGLWMQFHALVTTEHNRYALDTMAEAHANARRQIMTCRSVILSAIPECFALLDTRYAQAKRFADDVIADAEQMLISTIDSYPKHMTLSKTS